MLPSKFISKNLLKYLHLETSSDLLFKRFSPSCLVISNFSFKERLHLRIARLTGAHLLTIFQVIYAFFLDLRFNNSFESSVSFFDCSLLANCL